MSYFNKKISTMCDDSVRRLAESSENMEHSEIRQEHYPSLLPESDDSFEIMSDSNPIDLYTEKDSESAERTLEHEMDGSRYAEPNPIKSLSPTEIEENVKRISSIMSGQAAADIQDIEESLDDLLDLYNFNQQFQDQTGQLLNKYGVTAKIVEIVEKSNLSEDDQGYAKVHLPALTICFKYSDASPAFAMELANHEVVEFLTKCLKYESLASESRSHLDFIKLYIGTLHNIAVDTDRNKHYFLEARTTQTLKKYFGHEDDVIRVTAVLTLSYIISEQDIKLLKNLPDNIVSLCTEWLKEAVETRTRTSRAGFRVRTLVLGLANLSVNEEINRQLKCQVSLQLLRDVMQNTNDDKERSACEKLLNAKDIPDLRPPQKLSKCNFMTTSRNSQTQDKYKKRSQNTQTSDGVMSTSQHTQPQECNKFTSRCAQTSDGEMLALQKQAQRKDVCMVTPKQGMTSKMEMVCSSQTALKELDILLVGKTGYGKSAAGNTIIGHSVFKSVASVSSVTKDVSYRIVNFEDVVLKIVDGPGVADTSDTTDIKNTCNLIIDKMKDAIILSPEGYHAFLLVIKFGNRFTAEDNLSVVILKQIFGKDFVAKYCILLVNGGDNFKVENPNTCFKDWCKEQTGVFQSLLCECNNRAVLFDNKSKDPRVRIEQVKELVRVIESLPNGGQRYTDARFQEIAEHREQLLLEAKEPMIREETLKQVSQIITNIERVSMLEDSEQLDELQKIRLRAKEIEREVIERDNGTDVLKYALQTTDTLKKTIENKIDTLKKLIAEKEKTMKLEEDLIERKEKFEKRNREEMRLVEEELNNVLELNRLESEKMRLQNDKLSRAFEERESKLRRALEFDRRDATALKDKLKLLEAELKNPNLEADQQKKLEKEKKNLNKELDTLSLTIESHEKNLTELINTERVKARQHFDKETKKMEKKLRQVIELSDTKIKEMKERENRLIKDFETEKESLGARFLLAARGLVDLKDKEHKANIKKVCSLFENMQNDHVRAEKEKAKGKKSRCSTS